MKTSLSVIWSFFDESDVSFFITTDVLLHIFHVVHDDILKEIEKLHTVCERDLRAMSAG